MAIRVVFHTMLLGYVALGLKITKTQVYSKELSFVAVCVNGQLRTHLYASVQTGFANHFHQPGYEYFFMIDEPLDATKTVLNPLRILVVDESPDVENITKPDCEGDDFSPFANALKPYYVRVAQCYDAIVAHEETRGSMYDYIIRVRPDHVFAKPFPHVVDLLKFASRDVVMFDDHIALASRKYPDMVFTNYLKAFSACMTTSEADRACMAASCVQDRNHMNCAPVTMTLKYSNFVPSLMFYHMWHSGCCGCEAPFEDQTIGFQYGPDSDNPRKQGIRWYFPEANWPLANRYHCAPGSHAHNQTTLEKKEAFQIPVIVSEQKHEHQNPL